MTETPVAGFITPPGWFDPTPAEFAGLCAAPVRTQQSILDLPTLDYNDLGAIGAAEDGVARAARLLGLAGADAVALTGTPFAWAGLSTEEAFRARVDAIARAAGRPAVLAGAAIVDALRALGAARISVLAPYYTAPWRALTADVMRACGFDLVAVASADELGLVSARRSIDDHAAASDGAVAREGLRRLMGDAPDLDALIIAGAGVRTLDLTLAAEAELGVPVVASDTALYWATARAIGAPLRAGALGRLQTAG